VKVDFGLNINKKDVVTVVLLCIVFFSIAVVNLGYTTYPTTVTHWSAGQSFYVDLGRQTNVKSVLFLLHVGSLNVTVSTGSPTGNWTAATSDADFYYSSGSWSEDYGKWDEVSVMQTTQYIKIDIGYVPSNYATALSQIAVVDQNNTVDTIQSITNVGEGNPDVNNLINAQSSVRYPVDYMENTYFDEIYFVRTAEQYLHLQSPYEWTHPPLGKLIQAGSILVFGFNPFGWRIMGVIFATLMIVVMYLLGKRMFGSWIGGFTSAFLLTFDFMHFTMGRLGTADTYVVFFSLASQLFFLIYLKNVLDKGWKTSVIPLFLAIMFAALGISTKWLVLFGFVGVLAILVVMRLNAVRQLKGKLSEKFYAVLDRPYSAIVAFLLLAIAIYFVIYIPDILTGRTFLGVLNLQDQMYIYHSTLTAKNGWESPWYSWPFMFNPFNAGTHVPYWFQSAHLLNGTSSTIVVLGNPAVWWLGFAAIVGLTVFTVPKILAFVISNYWSRKWMKVLAIIYFALVAALFVLGNPAIWWVGFAAIVGLIVFIVPKILKKRFSFSLKDNFAAVFILVIFFFQWLVYIFISRGTYDYHFYSNVPFLCLGSAFVISRYWGKKWMKVLAIIYFAVVVALFILFYPVISGVPTSDSFIKSLHWFKSWVF
jgi:dolichyl-phosphate-mannose-protein mannosyltransferase